jgi:hypothetical protein
MFAQDPMVLQAALRKLESWRLKAPAAKQRRFARFPVRCEARLWAGEGGVTQINAPIVHVRDLSRGGVGLLSSQSMETGQFCQVQFIFDKVVVETRPAFGRHCREVMPHAFLIGLEFAVEASLLMALGVQAKELALTGETEMVGAVAGEFLGPAALMDDESAA